MAVPLCTVWSLEAGAERPTRVGIFTYIVVIASRGPFKHGDDRRPGAGGIYRAPRFSREKSDISYLWGDKYNTSSTD